MTSSRLSLRHPEVPSSGRARVAVVGLGFAGLPTAVAIARAGFETIGIDIDPTKVERINQSLSASGVDSSELSPLVGEGLLRAVSDPSVLGEVDVVLVSVPTPIDAEGQPDERALAAAARTVVEHVVDDTLIVLQCTVVPGTTRRLFVEPLNSAGHTVGETVFVAYSPDRINPGDPVYHVGNTTKLVAGATSACSTRAAAFVGGFVQSARIVPALEAAELAKLVENTFRFVNISFMNEIALLCGRLRISVWDVIDAAATKPFAFMAHYPGPGIGGECIPVSPRYLEASAAEHGLVSELIPAGMRATKRMPAFVVDRCAEALSIAGRDFRGVKVAVAGLAYKPNIADARHSPAIGVIRALVERGASVSVLDPFVHEIHVDGTTYISGDPAASWPDGPVGADAVIVVTPHKGVDYGNIASAVRVLLDTRNALEDLPGRHELPAGRIVAL